MKKFNEKGFTLIELLAVIVILAILMAVATPAISSYLRSSRQGALVDNATVTIDAARNDFVINSTATTTEVYPLNSGCYIKATDVFDKKMDEATCKAQGGYYYPTGLNDLLEKKLVKSPYGPAYLDTSYVKVTIKSNGSTGIDNIDVTYEVCLTDGTNGVTNKSKDLQSLSTAKDYQTTKCTLVARK